MSGVRNGEKMNNWCLFAGAGGPQILGYCRASYDYSANQPNQLSLRKDDRVGIISRAGEDRGWWKGQLRGKVTNLLLFACMN